MSAPAWSDLEALFHEALACARGDRAAFLAALRARDVEMVEYPHGQVRAVTHYGVTASDIETVITATREALAETSPIAVPAPA